MSKSRRLLDLMKWVQTHPSFTVRQLAEEFGVSYRTMLRDLQDLSELGVPLYSEQGTNGGYRVLRERTVPPIQWGDVSTKTLATLGLRGRTQTNPEIVYKPEFRIVGISFTGHYEQLFDEMPKVWSSFIHRCTEVATALTHDVWLDVAQENQVTNTFTQYVSVEVSSFSKIPYGMVGLTIPAQRYAVFTHTGSMSGVEETYYSAFHWLDENDYQRIARAIRFELYDHRYNPALHARDRVDNAYDIYIPIR